MFFFWADLSFLSALQTTEPTVLLFIDSIRKHNYYTNKNGQWCSHVMFFNEPNTLSLSGTTWCQWWQRISDDFSFVFIVLFKVFDVLLRYQSLSQHIRLQSCETCGEEEYKLYIPDTPVCSGISVWQWRSESGKLTTVCFIGSSEWLNIRGF